MGASTIDESEEDNAGMSDTIMIRPDWLRDNATIPVDVQTTRELVDAVRALSAHLEAERAAGAVMLERQKAAVKMLDSALSLAAMDYEVTGSFDSADALMAEIQKRAVAEEAVKAAIPKVVAEWNEARGLNVFAPGLARALRELEQACAL